MAYEIQASESLYEPPLRTGDRGAFKARQKRPGTAHQGVVGVRQHTYQHDLESLWWLLLWIILTRIGYQKSRDAALNIFQETRTPTAERRIVITKGFTPSLFDCFHPDTNVLREEMVDLRESIYSYYKLRGPDILEDIATYSALCSEYISFFDVINEPLKRSQWAGFPINPPSGRPRVEEQNFLQLDISPPEIQELTVADTKKRERDSNVEDEDMDDELPAVGGHVQAQAGPSSTQAPAESSRGSRRSKRAKIKQ